MVFRENIRFVILLNSQRTLFRCNAAKTSLFVYNNYVVLWVSRKMMNHTMEVHSCVFSLDEGQDLLVAWTLTKLNWSAWNKCYVGAGRRVAGLVVDLITAWWRSLG